jgi:uncharacterized OsmC-like protein
VEASDGRLIGDAVGEVEVEDGVLVLKRVHVTYRLRVAPGADRERIQRAFDRHMPRCPVYRSIGGAVAITTSLAIQEG